MTYDEIETYSDEELLDVTDAYREELGDTWEGINPHALLTIIHSQAELIDRLYDRLEEDDD